MERNFFLENGIFCYGTHDAFRLLYKDYVLTPILSNMAYIPRKLIAVKSDSQVIVYAPKLKRNFWGYSLLKLAMFETYSTSACLKINIQGTKYIIDSNVQIKASENTKLY